MISQNEINFLNYIFFTASGVQKADMYTGFRIVISLLFMKHHKQSFAIDTEWFLKENTVR